MQYRGIVRDLTQDLMSSARTARDNSITYAGKAARTVKTPVYAVLLAGGLGITALGLVGNKVYASHAGDPQCQGVSVVQTDNTGNGGVGGADGDMDKLVNNLDSEHPIEFKITVPSAGPYNLTLKAYGVNTSIPDKVNFAGSYIGDLTGDNFLWSDSVYPVTVGSSGDKLVEIIVDNNNGGGSNSIEVACGSLTPPPSVGGITSLPDIGKYPLNADHSNGIDGKEIGFMAAGAVSAALAGAGAGLYYS